MKRIIVFFQILTCCIALTCQAQDGNFIQLKGKIVSAKTGEPLVFATIALVGNGIATLSNEEGGFVFKIPAVSAQDTILITHIGYQPQVLVVSGADTLAKTIALKEQSVELAEVTVTNVKPLELIRKAINRIPENYPSKPYAYYGFYRFAGWNNGKIVDLSEAIFDIYSRDNHLEHKKFRLIKVRADKDETFFQDLPSFPGRHPEGLMSDDWVSHIHEAPVVGDEEIDKLDFTYNGVIDDDGRPVYEILFDQKDGIQEPLHKGRILIEVHSLAFVSFEYGLSPKGVNFSKPKQPGALALHGLVMTINYRKYGGKYYLSHVRRDATWVPERIPERSLENKSIYLISRIDTTGSRKLRKPEGKLIDKKDAIEASARRNSSGGDSFWENYNSVEAEFNVDSALKAIRHQP